MEENRNLSLRLDAAKWSSVLFSDDMSHITNSSVNSFVAIDESVNESSSSLENHQHSIDDDQIRPMKKKVVTKSIKKTRIKKARASAGTMELIKSVCKQSIKVDDDELMHTFSARKKCYSIKKRLPMSTTKAQDPSPIYSPSEVLSNVQANDGNNNARPYNTRRARVKKNLF